MTNQVAADVVASSITLSFIILIFYGPWQRVCSDVARQMLYERRDQIFDLARAGHLAFDSFEYRHIRRTLNSAIAFSSELTWPKIILYRFFYRGSGSIVLVQHSIEKIKDPDVRKTVQTKVDESMLVLLAMMVMKSIFVSPITVVVCAIGVTAKGLNEIARWLAEQRNSFLRDISQTIEASSELSHQVKMDERPA